MSPATVTPSSGIVATPSLPLLAAVATAASLVAGGGRGGGRASSTTGAFTAVAVLASLLSSLPRGAAHNWMHTPGRARFRASTTKPTLTRLASDTHAQIGAGQHFVAKFATGHRGTSWFAIVSGKNESILSHPDYLKMLKDYIAKAPASAHADTKHKRFNFPKSVVDTAAGMKPYMDHTNKATVKDSALNAKISTWCDKTKIEECQLFTRRVPSTDKTSFLDNKLSPTEYLKGNAKVKYGALFEYRPEILTKVKDAIVAYKSDLYPWFVKAFKFDHIVDLPSNADGFPVYMPEWAEPGHYLLNWWWSGYYDTTDFDYFGKGVTVAGEQCWGRRRCELMKRETRE